MNYPSKIQNKQHSLTIDCFGGLNRRLKAVPGEFIDMKNILPDNYPCLSSSAMPQKFLEHEKIAKWIIPKYTDVNLDLFSGIVSGDDGQFKLLINDVTKDNGIESFYDAVDFNGQIITIPEFRGYDYRNNEKMKPSQITRKLYFTKQSDGVYKISFDTQVNKRARFKPGDSIVISGFPRDKNNTYIQKNNTDKAEENKAISVIVTKSESNCIYVIGYDINGNAFDFETDTDDKGTITLRTPKAAFACMNKNRLWVLGESGETIYASELGLPLQFYNYGTKATDSWYGDVGTSGKFTGIGTYQDKVLAFKEDEVHIVYGDTPSNFSIYRNYSIGCIDGKSIANVGGMTIWLYHDGFYAFAGSKPRKISNKLNTKYISCTAFTDNKRYYARCKTADGNCEILIYDTTLDTWHKISDFTDTIHGGEYFGGKIYVYNSNAIYKLFEGNHEDFYADSIPITFNTFENNATLYFYIRTVFDSEDAFVNIYTSVNGGKWIPHKGISKPGKSRLPIRYLSGDTFRFRIEGHGKVHITDIEIRSISEKS